MDDALRQKWETILQRHPDPSARERAREVLSQVGPSAETQEIAEGVADVGRPMSRADIAKLQGEMDRPAEGGGFLSQFNPVPLLQRADRALGDMLPEGARAFANKAWDTFTMGYGPKASDALGTTNQAAREAEYAASPTATALGGGTGLGASLMAGPGKLLAEGVSRGVARAAPALATSLQGRIGLPALSGALLAGMEAEGMEDPSTIPERMGAGAALGAAGGAAAAGAGAARKGIQKASPWVGRYAKAEEEGLIEGAKQLPKGREGVVKASENARDKILGRQKQVAGEEGAKYEAAEAAAKGTPGNVAAVRAQLDKIRQSNQLSSGQPIDRGLDNEISALESMLLDEAPVDDLLALRRSLQERANFSNKNPSDAERAARKLYEAMRAGVRESSTPLAAADDAFTASKAKETRTNEILGSPKGVKTSKQKRQAAAELEYYQDESIPALRRKSGLDELAGQDPAYLDAMKELGAKKALEATRLFTTEPGTRLSLSPVVQHFGGVPMQMAAQYGRGGLRVLDQSLKRPQRNPMMPLTLLDALTARPEDQ